MVDFGATPTNGTYKAAGSIRRTGTTIRSPIESRRDKGKDKADDGALRASEVSQIFCHYTGTNGEVTGFWSGSWPYHSADISRGRLPGRLFAN